MKISSGVVVFSQKDNNGGFFSTLFIPALILKNHPS
jgi:hypothetical protein